MRAAFPTANQENWHGTIQHCESPQPSSVQKSSSHGGLTVFAAGTYIATPEEDAGVYDGPGGNTGRIWSVGDSYLFRAGAGYTFLPKYGLTPTLGGRMEGTPSTDIIGGSEGRRRPGFAVSIEPGLVFAKNGWFASFSAPVAVYRNRERNFAGQEGDAAFADFMTLATVGRSF